MSQKLTPVKFAQPEDITVLAALAYKTHKELKGLPSTDTDKILNTITKSVLEGVPLVIRDEASDKIVGCLLGNYFDASWWSDDTVIGMFLFFVEPEHRNSKAAVKLVKAAKEFAEESSMPIALGTMGKGSPRKRKLFEKYGFGHYDTIHVYEPRT